MAQEKGPEHHFHQAHHEINVRQGSAIKWTAHWRTFFIAVAELFGYNDGEEWMVCTLSFQEEINRKAETKSFN